MQKQLNPDLFGLDLESPSYSATKSSSAISGASFDHILNLDQKLADLRVQVSELKDQVRSLKSEMSLLTKTNQSQIEQITRAIKVLEQNDQTLANQNQQKAQMLSQRLADYKNLESKIREMVDKHHMVLRSYDLKIQHLQNIISEKENSLVTLQAALQDAKNEIARLKRA
jgi:chromosome segregation ATPase